MKRFAIGVAATFIAGALHPACPAYSHGGSFEKLEASRVAAMRQATSVFLETLESEQRGAVVAALDNKDVRTNWSNLPISMAPRSGLAVSDMKAEQRRALHAMMAAAFSSQGYLKTTTIMWHEDVLNDSFTAFIESMPDDDPRKPQALAFAENYDSEKFFVSVFGDVNDDNWGWMVSGHHYAANFTVADGRIAFTPLFLGASPQIVQEGRYAGWRILQHEADRAFALLASLSPTQLEDAIISEEVDDEVFMGKGREMAFGQPAGLRASDLDPVQKSLLVALIDEYLDDASHEASARQRSAIEADGPETLYFEWWGPTDDPAARYMYRVRGPSILIDYVRERSPDGGFNHVHSIVRDPSNDYGSKWLELHYEEAHQD